MRIVIAGGTGFLGAALTASLRSRGHDVSVLARRAERPNEVNWAPGGGPGPWTATVQQADAVVNLAGAPLIGARWTPARKRAIRDSRTAATRALARAILSAARPPLFISGSAVGIYGARGDEPVDEDAQPGSDFLASVCLDWEGAAQEAAPRTRVVLVRTGIVLARRGGALPQLARPFWFFVGGPVGSGRQYVSWIHLDDWVGLVEWAMATAAAAGPLNATAPTPVTNGELATALGAALRRPSFLRTPALPLRLALGEMADAAILNGQRVVPAKAQALGFVFKYPTIDAALSAIYA